MRHFFLFGTLITLVCACRQAPALSFRHYNTRKLVAIQPFGDFAHKDMKALGDDISLFFQVPVLILNPIEIPATAHIDDQGGVFADSLLAILVRKKPDSITIMVGITHSDIFTKKTSDYKHPGVRFLEEQRAIFGLGHINGYASIVSNYRLASGADALFNYRLYKVVIHEMGHNVGLPHCPDKHCAMSATNGIIWMLDEANRDYCGKCRRRLGREW